MVLRFLLRYLVNNEKLIDRIAESYPIRRAAQLTIYMFHRSKALMEDTGAKENAMKLKDKLEKELKKEWEKSRGK